ncbi:MAG: helix-turn-helix domain-containing protein [Nocardioidaceae bacterium]|nr:helix-turn-helix domain-containing protein [Nocardioidaceae bacterium]
MASTGTPRFLTLADVAEILNISVRQVYALVRRADLLAIKIGGRGQWRVESAELERYIADNYERTQEFIKKHPFVGEDASADEDADVPDRG